MRLILSNHKPCHATYKDAVTGVVQYKVRSPIKVSEFISTITRRIDVDIPRRNSGHSQAGTDSDHSQAAGTTGDRFGLLAQLCWYLRGPSVMRFGGQEVDPATFFRKVKVPWYGLPVGIFTGKDGKEYKWSCTMYTTRLKVNDGSDTLVAEYRAQSLGLISKKRAPCLEIFPPFEHMADEIFITFICVERSRRSRNDGTQQL
ncbi:hypothetical protein B0H11DRAFT_203495 [Mycena galericulata]|nr:hypothetical protein B0H11DRAFT_203495 [Mycena galericulata]